MRPEGRMRLDVLVMVGVVVGGVAGLAQQYSPAVKTIATNEGGTERYGHTNYNNNNNNNNKNGNGHLLITRALWRIFDALMEKKDHTELYSRMQFVENALKDMITAESNLESAIDNLKEETNQCHSALHVIKDDLAAMKVMSAKVQELERWQLESRQSDDNFQGLALPQYSSCPSQFDRVGSECFLVVKEAKMTWGSARIECQKLGGDLASPRDLPALRKYLQNVPGRPEYVWVGGTRRIDGTWVWATGTQANMEVDMSKETWNDGVPSGDGLCMGLYEGGAYRAYDYKCTEKDLYICQYFL